MQDKKKKQVIDENELIFALDIGTRTIVGVIGIQVDDMFQLIDHIVVPHSKRAMIDGQIEDIKLVAKVIAEAKTKLEERNNIKLTSVSIAAAGRALKTRQITKKFDVSEYDHITHEMIKSMEIETIQEAQGELDDEFKDNGMLFHCVGHSIVTYKLDDYKILNLEGHKGREATIELIATFLPNVVVEGLYSVMDLNNLTVASLTLEPIAAMNVIIPQEIRLINIALVDIGAGTSDIAISKDGSIVAYAMATIAGDEITEEIIREFFVDFSTAEAMKHESTSGKKEFTYRDIFGITQKIKTDEFYKRIDKAVNNLAETICENIIKVNGSAPAAIFLVGGGSLILGLTEKVAKISGVDKNRVAIGGHENIKNADIGGEALGAEYITPLGIAVTSILNRGYDFSVIKLNDKSIRIFDTNKLTIFELLTMSGYKSHEIMGRSGRNLTYSLGGKHRTIKGGNLIPAEITVGGKAASLNTHVTQGDEVTFKPAVCGENAVATIGEVYDMPRNGKGTVTFGGESYEIGVEFSVDGKKVGLDYEIQSLDKIETVGILTLGDFINSLDLDDPDASFNINGEPAVKSTILADGDIIDFTFKPIGSSAKTSEISEAAEEDEDYTYQTPEMALLAGEITVTLNGEKKVLPRTKDKEPHKFVELFNFIDYDTSEPLTDYLMYLNGNECTFNSVIKDGDVIEIELIKKEGKS